MPTKTIKAGQTLTARSACDYECVYRVPVVARNKSFVTVLVHGNEKRVKVHCDEGVEFIYAFGRYSMAPIFRAID